MSNDNINSSAYERAYKREKQARKHAEELLEVKSREIFKINRDIEEQCSVLLKRTTELELLHDLAIFVQNDITTEEALQYFIDIVCTSFNWPVAHIYMPDPDDASLLKSANIWHLNENGNCQELKQKTKSSICKVDNSLPGQVFLSKQAIWLDDVDSSDICHRSPIPDTEINSAFAVPILTYGNVIAIAEFFTPIKLSSDESLLKIVETAALQMGTVLERRLSEKKTLENYNKLQETVETLKQTQIQLVQSEKLASVGQLAAGVAHEINNPIGFVSSNLRTLTEYIDSFKELFSFYKAALAKEAGNNDALLQLVADKQDELDITYINEDISQLLVDCLDGMRRVQDIVLGLKNFSRVDTEDMEFIDINDCITSTLKMLDNQLKYKAEVISNLSPLPKINCNAGKLNQVFTNLLVNAGHAIKDQGSITVNTSSTNESVIVTVSDTGEGIPEENIKNLFDPFFTTKAVGEGTGLGLSISYGIIQEHNGSIAVDSIVGKGTTFTINLPCTQVH